ncbi:MAG: hypothetical protein KDB44_07240 [Mycobacterium sp.]|nr:hypothetical protein [Mycobacterium sp.]
MRRGLVVAVLVLAGVTAGCSPPGERPSEATTSQTTTAATTTTTTSPSMTPTTTAAEPGSTGHGSLANCLSEHGVPASPGPTTGPPSGVDPATWEKAMAECSSLAPGPTGR